LKNPKSKKEKKKEKKKRTLNSDYFQKFKDPMIVTKEPGKNRQVCGQLFDIFPKQH
jgi:hypothetical protein